MRTGLKLLTLSNQWYGNSYNATTNADGSSKPPAAFADFHKNLYGLTGLDAASIAASAPEQHRMSAVNFADIVTFTRASTATYFDSTGTMQTAANDVPRFDYPFFSTNLSPYSTGSTGFNGQRTTPTTGQADPFGSNNAVTWAVDGTTDPFVAIDFVPLMPSSKTVTFSVWIRAATVNGNALKTLMYMYGSTSVEQAVSKTIDITTSWARYTFTNTFPAGMVSTGVTIRLDPYDGTGGTNVPIAGSSIQTFGWQLETGFVATPNITTTGTPVRKPYGTPALLVESDTSNLIRNSTMVGAATGSPGTNPNLWATNASSNGLAKSIVATGTINGMNYIDVRIQGTTTATSFFDILNLETINTGIPAVSTDVISFSAHVALIAGSMANLNTAMLMAAVKDSSSTYLGEVTNGYDLKGNISGALTRVSQNGNMAAFATAAGITPRISITYNTGVVVDFTLRFAAPQLEKASVAPTSFIPTSSGAVSRAIENVYVTPKILALINKTKSTIVFKVRLMDNIPAAAMLVSSNGNIIRAGFGTPAQIITGEQVSPVVSGIGLQTVFPGSAGITITYTPGNRSSATNNQAPVSDTNTYTLAASSVSIGTSAGGTKCSFWLDYFAIYPFYVAAAEAQRLSTVYF